MFKKLKEDIKYIGLSFTKEMVIFISLNVLLISGIVIMILFKLTNLIILMYALFIPIVDYLFLSRYKNIIYRIEQSRNNEFISLLSYLELFISNHNNVYQSLQMLISYSSDWMGEKLERLLSEIDNDKSVAPYIKFSKKFSNLVIENVMVTIYQMVEQGESKESLNQFDHIFSSLNSSLITSKIDAHEKGLDMLNAFPLIGAGLITLTLTLSIVFMLGGLTYVI